MKNALTLPFAPRFSAFLQSLDEAGALALTTVARTARGTAFDVTLGDLTLGTYSVYYARDGFRVSRILHWHGIIPGHRNACGGEKLVLSYSDGCRTDHNTDFVAFP